MKVLICGGRDFTDRAMFDRGMVRFQHMRLPIYCVIHGAARGADTMAHQWATERRISIIACPADWNAYGRAAGFIRNKQMLDLKPDAVIFFPGGYGTAHMVSSARQAGVPVFDGADPT